MCTLFPARATPPAMSPTFGWSTMSRPRSPKDAPTLLILSDLHMTSGKDPVRAVWSPTEDFFWDEEFRDFLDYHTQRGKCALIINGDLFDFLQVLARPSPEEARLYGIPAADVSPVYGLKSSEPATVFLIDKIVDGHPVAFRALAEFLRRGHRVILLRGNHDVQLFWKKAQERLLQRLQEFCPRSAAGKIQRNLKILPWIYMIPGFLYVEHGNQYEAATSFQNFLHPILPFDSPGTGRHIELDLGSIIIRYFSNRMEIVNLLSDNIRPLSDYVQTFLRHHPLLFVSMAGTAMRYLVNALSKARRLEAGPTRTEYLRIRRKNDELIAREAQLDGLSGDQREELARKLKEQDARKASPVLGRGPWRVLWEFVRTPVQFAASLAPLLGLLLVSGFGDSIRNSVPGSLSETAGAIARLLLAALCVVLAVSFSRRCVRRNAARKARANVVSCLRREAEAIARDMQVRFVVFGHSHVEDIKQLGEGRWYFNTGTWITVYSESENLYRNPRQFSYLKIEKGKAALLFWDPASRAPREAVVADPEAAHAPPEENLRSLVRKALRLRRPGMSLRRDDRTLEALLERWRKRFRR
jgi:UDP-2,3-diacylglucosamine pyrophosphatase LpxH